VIDLRDQDDRDAGVAGQTATGIGALPHPLESVVLPVPDIHDMPTIRLNRLKRHR
jgi:hypothetical protein